jgi:general secretion pathway protein F
MSEPSTTNGLHGRLSGAETAELSERIAGLTRAGLPLGPGLGALADELPRGRLRQSIKRLAHTLESGVTLAEALENEQGNIPPHLRGLVIAGTRSGRLSEVLGRFTQYTSISEELGRRLWINLAYPVLTAVITALLFLGISGVIVPQFEWIFKDFGVPLPGFTLLVLKLAHVANAVTFPVVLLVVVSLGVWVSGSVVVRPALRRSLLGQIPLVGKVWRLTSLAEFCHLLALLIESRLPLAEALRLTGEGVQDTRMQSACGEMSREIERGASFYATMSESAIFPRGLPALVRWAETRQTLPEVLHMAGSMFEARARTHAGFAGTVLTVVCVLLILGMILVVPALFLPLINLISRLSG